MLFFLLLLVNYLFHAFGLWPSAGLLSVVALYGVIMVVTVKYTGPQRKKKGCVNTGFDTIPGMVWLTRLSNPENSRSGDVMCRQKKHRGLGTFRGYRTRPSHSDPVTPTPDRESEGFFPY